MLSKRVLKEISKKKKKNFLRVVILFLLFNILISVVAVSATDVAYIYRKDHKIDDNILDVFDELELDVDLIQENYLPIDFSDYKMIFVGDEILKNPEKIPVTQKASVIANYYHGEEWGLTDFDGVSKLAANDPLNVKKGIQVMPVYTDAFYSLGGINIPYYYLDDENKAPAMQTVARTYTGLGEYNFGDVISYAYPNGDFVKGNNKEKVCFFGIIESDYWTNAARHLFKDCVNFVMLTCEKDSDCGSEELGEKYCEGNKIYQDVLNYNCVNPGTSDSECSENIEMELVQECDDICKDGECEDIACYIDEDCIDMNSYTKDKCIYPGKQESYCQNTPLECLENSDCGTDGHIGDFYCQDNDIYQDYQDFECENNECKDSIESRLMGECDDICKEGECLKRECTVDDDCREDYHEENYCSDDKVYQDFHDFSCQEEVCVEDINTELIEECDDICKEGECLDVTCTFNFECGMNDFIKDRYCDNNIYQDFISFTCHNAGTTESYCFNYTLPILIDYCAYDCVDTECINECEAECNEDIDCVCEEDYCIETTLIDYSLYSSCETEGSECKSCSTCEPVLILDSPECDSGVEECEHDVGVRYSYGNSFGTGIAIKEDSESSNWIEGVVELTKDKNYIIKYYIDNKIENTIHEINVLVEINDITLADYETSIKGYHYKEVDLNASVLDVLESGSNNISVYVEKINEIDCNLTDNHAEREISILSEDIQGCGNSNLDDEEECDDGNLINDDGCDDNCNIENEPECEVDEDCKEDLFEEWTYYCDLDDVHRQRREIDKSCKNNACFSETIWKDEFVEYCFYGCVDGKCEEPECSNDFLSVTVKSRNVTINII